MDDKENQGLWTDMDGMYQVWYLYLAYLSILKIYIIFYLQIQFTDYFSKIFLASEVQHICVAKYYWLLVQTVHTLDNLSMLIITPNTHWNF